MSRKEENHPVQETPEKSQEQEAVQSLGEKIKRFREQKPYTQSELAEQLSVTRQAVSNWERDKTLPDVYTLQQIAALFSMTLDEFMEGTKESEVTMPKTPGRLAAATGAVIFGYLVAGGMTGHLYVDCVVIMVIIGVFIQLFLHLFFSGSVKTGNFSMLAGYDGKVEYNLEEVKKVLIQMDVHIGCISFGTILLFGISAFLEESRWELTEIILIFAYCVDLCVVPVFYNYRSIDRILVRELDRRIAKAGYFSVVCFLVQVLGFVAVTFAKAELRNMQNNSPESVGYLGWMFLFLAIVITELFYEQHRIKKKITETGSYRPGAVFWLSTALAGAVTVLMYFG